MADETSKSTAPGSVDAPGGLAADARHAGCGLMMGAADIVPGVSGGTVALILGIYARLVGAISRFDGRLVRLVLERRLLEAARHIDLRFLVGLGAGIGAGVLGLASVMNRLLTLAAFFGLILASSAIVGRLALRDTKLPAFGALAVLAAGFAFWLTGLEAVSGGDPSLPYVFFSGAITICAMILPGISGAFLLLLLGMYVPITGILKRLPKLDVTTNDVVTVAVFSLGCGIGLLAFSRVLRILLDKRFGPTMSVLAGFMIGSLRKIWPFQRDVTLENLDRAGLPAEEMDELRAHPELVSELDLKHRLFENVSPTGDAGELVATLGVGLAAAVVVLVVDAVVRRREGSSL